MQNHKDQAMSPHSRAPPSPPPPAPNPHVEKAVAAMEALGIPKNSTLKVLKKLLPVYNNWEPIEQDNYRLLADMICERQERQETKKRKNAQSSNHSDLQSKRLNSLSPENRTLLPTGSSMKTLELDRETKESSRSQPFAGRREVKDKPDLSRPKPSVNKINFGSVSRQGSERTKGKEPMFKNSSSSQSYPRKDISGVPRDLPLVNRTNSGLGSQQGTERAKGKGLMAHNATRKSGATNERFVTGVSFREPKVDKKGIARNDRHKSTTLVEHRSEPHLAVPISMVPPPSQCPAEKEDREDGDEGISLNGDTTGLSLELKNISEDTYSNFEIASSPLGEVRVSLSCCSSTGRPEFQIPSLDAVLRLARDEGPKSHRIVSPNFSLLEMIDDLCQCFLGLTANHTNDGNITKSGHFLKKLNSCAAVGSDASDRGHNHMANSSSNGSPQNFFRLQSGKKIPETSNCNSSMLVQHTNLNLDGQRWRHNLNDISKGEERVKIRVVNHINNELYPPHFRYISQNTIYQNAHVDFSLARIGDEQCCSECFGDCLTSPIPCACTGETGGLFAYTADGLVKTEFLDECDPAKNHLYYCEDCPLERGHGKCKGHVVRKFIKECWNKCGCDKQCGNRVVQRGITRNLEVSFISEAKGWGVQTLEDLPKGAFVCEYVGEILTNTELYYRNESAGNERHTYPVLLDADWSNEGILDEDALCLDATRFGNVARFINHRCHDANLVELPVEIETPDHHYYHIAFFTSRAIAASEELTWDYGIDFNDDKHPVKAFRCQCGSKYCRDIRSAQCTKTKPKIWR